ncbi:ABC transporter permease [Aliidiomarina taiwanensis]|uniref:ABC transporter permease n=1 Tax=Aliidiomarina taiwanensis TaxID=946228 RepID=A0A432X1X6_9GAMM|nr:FtsX-like permease family protein [Aliidiomarina taiwanensis]RUO40545.1 ABC transporter permease [Aliidiomarina taiwanensis]
MRREFRISWRLLRHEMRRGELTIMALAVALAVAAVLSLSLFSERLQQGLVAQSSAFMAADRVLQSSRPLPEQWFMQATEAGLEYTERVSFSSMIFGQDQLALAQVKAVGQGYPLRGQLLVATEAFAPGEATQSLPASGEAWVHSGLMGQLNVTLGDTVEVGDKRFTITQVLIKEPDASLNLFNDQPTVLIPLADLAATNLIQPGSRVQYHGLFAGALTQLSAFENWLLPQLDPLTQDWRSVEGGDSPLAAAMQRANRFMLLASLLGVVLAATAVAVAAQRYTQRNYDAVAIMKALGGRKRVVGGIFIAHLALLSLFSIGLGLLLGYLLQTVVVFFVSQQLGYVLPAASWGPWWLALATGLLTAILFSLYPLIRLLQIPPLRVLRRELEGGRWGVWLHGLFCGLSVYLLMLLYSGNWLLSAALFAGGIVAAVVLLLVGRLFIRLSRTLGMQAGSSWRLAMANMQRRGRQNSLQMISFATAIMLFLLVLALRNELLADWQKQLPENAPNYFVVNVKGEQIEPLHGVFAENNIEATDFYPITPGRLLAVNGELVADAVPASEQGEKAPQRQGFGRELQLTWRAQLPPENTLVAGSWWPEEADYQGVSVESSVAERMQIALGDILTFRIGADDIQVPVRSIRDVNWNSMQPNFYMIFSPAAFAQVPVTYIGSFYLPESRQPELYNLFTSFPQISLIDIAGVMEQVRTVIGHVSLAITFVMVLVILAGALVLVAQVQASLDERQQELVILRTLGAKQRLLSQAVWYEFLVLGALAGFIAALAMELSVFVLQSQVFQMPASVHPRFWLLGPLVGACLVASLGWLSIGRLMQQRTADLIRLIS